MANTVIRGGEPSTQESVVARPDPEPNKVGAQEETDNLSDTEPLEVREERSGNLVYEALGIEETQDLLPSNVNNALGEINEYVKEIVRKSGKSETVGSFKETLDSLKEDMGMPDNASPEKFIERLHGVIRAWKDLSFIKDSDKRREIFTKIANMESVKDINRYVFDVMQKYEVWQ